MCAKRAPLCVFRTIGYNERRDGARATGRRIAFVIVYNSTIDGFLDDAFRHDIEVVVRTAFKARTGREVARAEVRSWKESLIAVAKVLNDESIPRDCGVAIEYGIPQTSKRIDFIVSGTGPDERDQLLVIELKQWESARRTNKDGVVVTRFAGGESEVSHPSYQAWSYASLLENFNSAIHESDIQVRPCAYLHNCSAGGDLAHDFYGEYLERAPLFLQGDSERERLREFLRRHVRSGDRGRIIYEVEGGRIRPSKSLVDALVGMIDGKQEFVLIDDQKVAYETILEVARKAAATSQKHVVIVEGGPGTGKSVIAINLLVTLTANRLLARYVTKNRAPRQVFEHLLAGTKTRTQISNLFGNTGAFVDTAANVFDVLAVDEAHRLNEKSGFYGNEGNHQVEEIIGSSKCAVFFIDEDQRVTWKDIGDKRDIELRARRAGAQVARLSLASQFRCSGSDGYLAWLDDVLGIRPTANPELDTGEFDFRVLDTPGEVRQLILERNAVANRARMVAGYCWDWRSRNDPSQMDVVIPERGFGMQWNLSQDEGLWIVAERSVEQIGCIHTCQGLEVDYIGVVIGPDLVARDGRVVAQPERRSKHDKSLNGYKKLLKESPEAASARAAAIIRNTYRTLMTRGMKGCYVYCTDDGMRDHLRARLKPQTAAQLPSTT